jgi:hypothetical protein
VSQFAGQLHLRAEKPEDSIASSQGRSWMLLVQDGPLLTQGKVLQNELAAWLQEQAEDTADHAEQFHAIGRYDAGVSIRRALRSGHVLPSSHTAASRGRR